MIEVIKLLEKNGYAYLIKDDGMYYDISKFKNYGKLSHQNIEDLKAGARIEKNSLKRNNEDFALWKFSKPGEPEWSSPWGDGRPGWHIECSAMSKENLGIPFDIHGGGQDLIFPHHEDEIAQSEAAFGKKFVNYWIHNGLVNVDNVKMSKSLGNFKTIKDILKDYSGEEIRYFVLSTQYRKPIDFSKEALDGAKNSYTRLKNIIKEIKDDKKINERYLKEFEKAINNDLDMPKALAVLWTLIRDEKAEGKFKTIEEMDSVFGLDLLKKDKIEVPSEIRKLAEEREKARKEKNWKKADELRENLRKHRWEIRDIKEGYQLIRFAHR
jgi:cysteinyl-tRNA synthetase